MNAFETERRTSLVKKYRTECFALRATASKLPDEMLLSYIESSSVRQNNFEKISAINPEVMAYVHEFVYREESRRKPLLNLSPEDLL